MNQQNDFKAFSISDNANVVSQEKYEESQNIQTGFPQNDISTHVLNKVLRQSSTIASVVANFIATQFSDDVLDDGRGVDKGRILLTNQSDALQDLKGSFMGDNEIARTTEGVFVDGGVVTGTFGAENNAIGRKTIFDATRVARTSHETRPRNIAFNYIVKAE
ncbi:hypothetical protein BB987_05400 [Photorhabdus temperata]|uniref:Uncharacterized protein n=1 Tax=Photorhabdus khanii NC19 TaxID=1004151 RepID=W3VDE2_9GAMM|nr:hypothetical protein [Photorhabdus khanii]ETS33064.1 hypothetical protein PTE_00213 [Photorhabdus khanii NC19]OHV56182.1 hypothetical protein BB987_05400 [Photorhabdus temperata]